MIALVASLTLMAADAGTPPTLSLPYALEHGWGADLARLPRGWQVNDPALVAFLGVGAETRQTVVVEGAFLFGGARTILVRVEDPRITTFLTRFLVRVDETGTPRSRIAFGTWGFFEKSAVAIDAQGAVQVVTEHRSAVEGWTRARAVFTALGTLGPQLTLRWAPHSRECFREPRSYEDLCIDRDGARTMVWYLAKAESHKHDVQQLVIVGEPTLARIDFHFPKNATQVWSLERSGDGATLTLSANGMGRQVYLSRRFDYDEKQWLDEREARPADSR